MAVTDILSRLPNAHQDVSGTLDKINNDSANLPHGHKFLSRPELDASGLSKTYDEIQSRAVKINGFNTASSLMEIKLDREKTALSDIKKTIVGFKVELVNVSRAIGDNKTKADRALTQIQTILNRTHADGKYIFGGSSPEINPLNFDITKNSNIVDNHVINNYSNSSSNSANINVSSKHNINVSYIHAGMEEISNYIGALNKFKDGDQDAQQALETADENFDSLQLKLGFAIDKIAKGRTVNAIELKEASQLQNNLFKEGVDVIAGRISEMRNSLFAGFTIQGLTNKIFDRFMERS